MLIHENKSTATIAEELEYSLSTIYHYIQELKSEGELN
ncbi:helix-turn-helix domain-containing protein [Priestia aryabhattai]|nr:helix-turn-helix domain-containing protein [Priestia aryabhattai]MBY0001508.1 helix-turn-helix domain-containing protein [Priestia aryabhattai]